jgi:transcriptional regulator with XRE-family HTH domain
MARTAPFRRTIEEELRDPEFARAYTEELERLRLAEQIAQARREAGLTQRQLAERMGTSQPVVSRLESRDYKGYTLNSLFSAARALGRSLRVNLDRSPVATFGALPVHAFAKKAAAKKAPFKRMGGGQRSKKK